MRHREDPIALSVTGDVAISFFKSRMELVSPQTADRIDDLIKSFISWSDTKL